MLSGFEKTNFTKHDHRATIRDVINNLSGTSIGFEFLLKQFVMSLEAFYFILDTKKWGEALRKATQQIVKATKEDIIRLLKLPENWELFHVLLNCATVAELKELLFSSWFNIQDDVIPNVQLAVVDLILYVFWRKRLVATDLEAEK